MHKLTLFLNSYHRMVYPWPFVMDGLQSFRNTSPAIKRSSFIGIKVKALKYGVY